jgi:molybdopterin synthase catalytic subunit
MTGPEVSAVVVQGPVRPPAAPLSPPGAGALFAFRGVVRPFEADREISGLTYESYDPMATRMLGDLAREAVSLHGLLAVRVAHSRGFVPAGECSFLLEVAAFHRKEAVAAVDWYVDRLKRDVPIWKRPVDGVTS